MKALYPLFVDLIKENSNFLEHLNCFGKFVFRNICNCFTTYDLWAKAEFQGDIQQTWAKPGAALQTLLFFIKSVSPPLPHLHL